MNGVLRYLYLPVMVGGGWKYVLLSLRLYLRYRMVTCFYSDAIHPLWRLLPWLNRKTLPAGCPAFVTVEALLLLCEENASYIPLLFLSPACGDRLTPAERNELESRFILCDDAPFGKLSALFPPDRAGSSRPNTAGVHESNVQPKGFL